MNQAKIKNYYINRRICCPFPMDVLELNTAIVNGIITKTDSILVHRYMPSLRGLVEIERCFKLSEEELSFISRAKSCFFAGGPTILFIDLYYSPYLKLCWVCGSKIFTFGYIDDKEYWWKCDISDVDFYITNLN